MLRHYTHIPKASQKESPATSSSEDSLTSSDCEDCRIDGAAEDDVAWIVAGASRIAAGSDIKTASGVLFVDQANTCQRELVLEKMRSGQLVPA
jgi:hypothetical protein